MVSRSLLLIGSLELILLAFAAVTLAARLLATQREEETALLTVSLRQVREMPKILEEMLTAYRKGDLATLERTLNIGLEDFPMLRKRLLKDRHVKWLPQIEKMIADGRSHMIIVGDAHLVGPDSVIAMLRAKGVKVEGP